MRNSKKLFVAVFAIALIAAQSVFMVNASQNRSRSENSEVQYADANSDGICDNKGENKNFTDADNNGICDKQNNRNGKRCGLKKRCNL